MKTSDNGRKLIEAFEGLFLSAYRDSVGVLTIGYGHTTAAGGPPVYSGQRITEAQADTLLADDLARVEQNVSSCIHISLSQSEFDALVSFDFNTGKLRSGSIATKINAGDKQAAMDTLLQYNHAGGQVLNGLTRRRNAEKLLFEGKVNKALRLAGTKPVTSAHVGTTAVIVTGTAVATQHPDYWPYIIIGSIAAAAITWFVIKYINKRKQQNERITSHTETGLAENQGLVP